MNRIDRLTAILIQLQTKRVVRAEEISERFGMSLRTVYRDVKALMEAGVPIGSEAGKGYFIVDGYHLPPVMFNEDEASALLMAGKLVEKMTDRSVRSAYESALMKIKSVLHESEKDHLEHLQSAMEVKYVPGENKDEFPNHFITTIQKALTQKEVLDMEYISTYEKELTKRSIEPIGMVYYRSGWHLIAWCRLRNGYRDFRADRIKALANSGNKIRQSEPDVAPGIFSVVSSRLTRKWRKLFLQSIRMHFVTDHSTARFPKKISASVYAWCFLTGHLNYLARLLLMYGTSVEIEQSEKFKDIIRRHGRRASFALCPWSCCAVSDCVLHASPDGRCSSC